MLLSLLAQNLNCTKPLWDYVEEKTPPLNKNQNFKFYPISYFRYDFFFLLNLKSYKGYYFLKQGILLKCNYKYHWKNEQFPFSSFNVSHSLIINDCSQFDNSSRKKRFYSCWYWKISCFKDETDCLLYWMLLNYVEFERKFTTKISET